MKAAVAKFGKQPSWRTVRPPLTELTGEQEQALLAALETSGFRMTGL
jgi:hypothetical protein